MSNMSYCRFHNTALDMRDCLDNWTPEDRADERFDEDDEDVVSEYEGDNAEGLSDMERRGHRDIVEYAKEILEKEGYTVEKDD